jgi:hypothetical protein
MLFAAPIPDEAVGAVVPADVVLRTTFAGNNTLSATSEEIVFH